MHFSIKTRCTACEGTGGKDSIVDSNDILSIVLRNSTDIQVHKIDAIKAVRKEYAIGLREAKELVEGAMAFLIPIQAHASAPVNPEENELPW